MKILMIDDEEDIRKVGLLSLERVGKFQVRQAANAPDGLALARQDPPDVILLDVMMPGMDGPAALEEILKEPALAKIPVIFLTAKVQAQDLERYLGLGATGVIQKPFNPMTLPGEIRDLLAASQSGGSNL